jgi:hypothetical protein
MTGAFRSQARIALLGGLLLALSAPAANAQRGGGAGGGGGGISGLKSTTFSLAGSLWSPASNGIKAPGGTATLSYDATQTTRSVSVKLGNVSLPDGTVLNVVYYELIVIGTYYTTPVYSFIPHKLGTMVVAGGAASGSVSTANGDAVPLFAPDGQIDVYMVDAAGNNTFDIAYGSYTTGGGNPGHP